MFNIHLLENSSIKKLGRKIIKYAVLFHRYLGIVFGLLILLWCLSGFVMMFVQYPSLSKEERYRYMAPLELVACCELPDVSLLSQTQFETFVLEQKPYGPQLKLSYGSETYFFDATSGAPQRETTPETRSAYANQIATVSNAGLVQSIGTVNLDQWSIIPSVARHAPFDVYELNDAEKTQLYFSQLTGELVQQVSFNERTWGWFGAVIHWIYPTVIRSNTELWAQLVIWLSVISLFMVVVGAILGVARLRHRGHWRTSPYRGRFLWHHYTSLIAGVLMLTWLFSGLMSMYPWGLMEGRSFADEKQKLRGQPFYLTPQIKTIFDNLDSYKLPEKTVEIAGVKVAGYLNLTATNASGRTTLVQRVAIDPAAENEFPAATQLAARMRPEVKTLSVDLLTSGDRYYYSHHNKRTFPVYRIIYEDGERIYLDGLSLDIVAVFDSGRKTARWLYLGLHRGDFFPDLNGSPLWYLVWGGLLLIVTFAVGVGCWLAFRCWQRLLFKKRQRLTIAEARTA